jgi:hypothetical protein
VQEVLARWPPWYWLLVLYTRGRGIGALRRYHTVYAPWIAQSVPTISSPRQQGWVLGARIRYLLPPILWILGAAGLFAGVWWIRPFVAFGHLVPVRRQFRDFAVGMAEGRKAAKLAAAAEYVRGRATPRPFDQAIAAIVVSVTCFLPFVATLYSLWAFSDDGS